MADGRAGPLVEAQARRPGARADLLTGFTDAVGQPVLWAIPKAKAHQLIDILVGLYGLAANSLPTEAVVRLEAVVFGDKNCERE